MLDASKLFLPERAWDIGNVIVPMVEVEGTRPLRVEVRKQETFATMRHLRRSRFGRRSPRHQQSRQRIDESIRMGFTNIILTKKISRRCRNYLPRRKRRSYPWTTYAPHSKPQCREITRNNLYCGGFKFFVKTQSPIQSRRLYRRRSKCYCVPQNHPARSKKVRCLFDRCCPNNSREFCSRMQSFSENIRA